MLKGKYLESQVDRVITYINSSGGHAHKNYPRRNIDGQFLEGEPFDFECFIKNYKCVFDAKECETNTWHMKPKDIKQANNLKACKNNGLDAYFLILFENKELKQIDIDTVIEVLNSGKKSINKSLGQDWDLLKVIRGNK